MFLRLDKYISKSFIFAFLVCLFIICGLYVVVDLSQKLDELIELGDKGLQMGLEYYAFLIPVIISQLLPAIILLAVGITVVRLAKNNELVAINVGGISMFRILMPIFMLVLLISIAAIGNEEWFIPSFARRLEMVKQEAFGNNVLKNLLAEDRENNMLLRVWKYDIKEKKMESVFALARDAGGRKKRTIFADNGKWIGNGKWYLANTTIHNYDASGKWVAPVREFKDYFLETNIAPEHLTETELDPSLLSLVKLKALYRNEPENPRFGLLFHSRIAHPFMNFVLILLGIPFITGYEKTSKSIFFGIGASVLVCGAFYLITFLCSNLSITGNLNPVFAAWLPIFLFGSLGLFLFEGIKT
jgi:LPS export ABC transporter permease LptG